MDFVLTTLLFLLTLFTTIAGIHRCYDWGTRRWADGPRALKALAPIIAVGLLLICVVTIEKQFMMPVPPVNKEIKSIFSDFILMGFPLGFIVYYVFRLCYFPTAKEKMEE